MTLEATFIGGKKSVCRLRVVRAISRAIGHVNWIDKREPTVPFTTVAPVIVVDVGVWSIPVYPFARSPVADVDWWFDEGGDCAMFSGRIFAVLACTHVVHNSHTLTVWQP